MTDHAKEPTEASVAAVAVELPGNYFELYKLAVEMADRISARRGIANTFFLTINTGLVALIGSSDIHWFVAAAGIAFSISWWALLRSYKALNAAKFEVILAMEESLPVKVYADEWARLQSAPLAQEARRRTRAARRLAQYRELGTIERVVPAVFALIYILEMIPGTR